MQDPVTARNKREKYYEYLLTSIVSILMHNVLRRAATTKFVTFGMSSEKIAGTIFQHLRVILNLLDGATSSLCAKGSE